MMATNTLHTACENPTLCEIHRSKISLHCAKTGYSYPTIRLPHTLSTLAGLSTRIYRQFTKGHLPFLWSSPAPPWSPRTPSQPIIRLPSNAGLRNSCSSRLPGNKKTLTFYQKKLYTVSASLKENNLLFDQKNALLAG
jgi:hypothetical protein